MKVEDLTWLYDIHIFTLYIYVLQIIKDTILQRVWFRFDKDGIVHSTTQHRTVSADSTAIIIGNCCK